MGYIEDIQKINNLAKEMLNHGMADSLDQAVSKAQETLHKSGAITLDLTDMKEKIAEQNQKKAEILSHTQTEPQTGQVNIKPVATQQTGITWQEAMTKNTQYVVAQLKSFEKAFIGLNNEIQQLKREMQASKRAQANFEYNHQKKKDYKENCDNSKEQVCDNSKEQIINIEDEPPKKQEQHPKQGKFTPNDVSIEKVFYSGNK